MNKRKRIACFFTAGYTELNAMKLFMRKINDQAEYIQLCPTGNRRSKDAIRNRHIENINKEQNGLTGRALIGFVTDFVGKKRFLEEHYDAILIEDDKDDRFLKLSQDGGAELDEEAWRVFKQNVIKQIHDKCPQIPVIFFYAAPEVEAWFLADWQHGFGSIYNDTFKSREYFNFRFKKYINESILTNRYRDNIESYGYFDRCYRKLSEQIQNALQEKNFLEGFVPKLAHSPVVYSKKIQGEAMLRQIDPGVVLCGCQYFFREGCLALGALAGAAGE